MIPVVVDSPRPFDARNVHAGQALSASGKPLETTVLGSEGVATGDDQTKKAQPARSRSRLGFSKITFKAAWLRWVFMGFLIAAGAGIVASTYYHFAEQRGGTGFLGLQVKDGVIGGAENVNLRSEPSGAVLAVLPAGTRVRVLEERGSWSRVRILQWMGAAQAGAPDNGWVGNQYVKSE